MSKRPEIPKEFYRPDPEDPGNTTPAKHARAAQRRELNSIADAQRMTNARLGTHTFKPLEHQVHEAPAEVRKPPFFTCVLAFCILLLAIAAILIMLSKLPDAISALQTEVATLSTLPTLTASLVPTRTPTATRTYTPTPTTTLTFTPRPTLTSSATLTATRTQQPTATHDYTATLKAAQREAIIRADATTAAHVLATVTAMSWTTTPTMTATPTETAVPVAIITTDEDVPFIDGALVGRFIVVLFCVGIPVIILRSFFRGNEEKEYAETIDFDEERLHQTIKPIREETAELHFEPYRALFIAIARLDNFDCRSVADALKINKDQAAAATAYMYERLGALRYKGATAQTGYRLSMERAELIDRLQRLTRAPLPDWSCPDFRAPLVRQDKTQDTIRHRQTEKTETLQYDERGKPIFR